MPQHTHPRPQRLGTWLLGSLAGLSRGWAGMAQATLLTFSDPTAFLSARSTGPYRTPETLAETRAETLT